MLDTDLKVAVKIAEKLRKIIDSFEFNDVNRISCSFGVTALIENDSTDSFIDRADKALYRAKGSGRNRVVGIRKNQPQSN